MFGTKKPSVPRMRAEDPLAKVVRGELRAIEAFKG